MITTSHVTSWVRYRRRPVEACCGLLGAGVAMFGATTLLANADGQGGTDGIAITIIQRPSSKAARYEVK